MRVLLIDDTPEIAELLSFALRDHGFDVVAVGFDSAICDLVAEHAPDALVLDCTSFDMTEMLFDAVRANPGYAALPIVVVSDTPEKADTSLRRRQAEHVLLIPKPFTAGNIARALTQLIGQPSPSPAANVNPT
ncbi:MAG TPA: response regulator [Vicinamibacterales bacterium]|jgi:CheY-like chemotaxis protein|nr:response regulator [Vicinamibacterales bacterium]